MTTILIADDISENRYLLIAMLKGNGYEVMSAENGAEALALALESPPDLILTDILMPVMDGFELCRRWKTDQRLKAIPFVFYTATYTDPADERFALSLGAERFLVKPQKPEVLVQTVREVLKEAQSRKPDSPSAALLGAEPEALRLHNEVLLRKLQQKVAQLQTEIAEHRQTEAERARLLTAIEQAGEVILITDPEGVIQYANPAFEQVTGYSRQEVLGQNPRLLKSGKQDEAFYRELWQTIAGGRTWQGRIVNRRKDGSLYTESATISPVRDADGRIVHFVAVKRDITDHLRLEAQYHQAQRMESVGRLAAGIAHEYNNQLTVISGFAKMVARRLGPEHPLGPDLAEIETAAQRSVDLTRQLLTFTRQQPMEPRILDLNDAVTSALKMLRQLIGEDIELAWHPAADLWPVRIDPGQAVQLLANLCTNARDAIAGPGRIILLSANLSVSYGQPPPVAAMPAGAYVVLSVNDNGSGMDPQILERIFEPFFTTKGTGQGTGLGLATVYGIVTQNHGFIDVASRLGEGTTFAIYFPRFATQAAAEAAAAPAPLPRGQGETVLVVEDEPGVIALAGRLLEELGYRSLLASSLAAALELAADPDAAIDLLLTDVVMPDMDGHQLAARLRTGRHELPCLFMSGYTADAIARYGAPGQGVLMIQKPFSREELATRLRQLLDRSSSTPHSTNGTRPWSGSPGSVGVGDDPADPKVGG